MKLKSTYYVLYVIIVSLSLMAGSTFAQEKSASDDAAQANNPLANMTAFNIQNYYIGELTSFTFRPD